MGAHTGRVKMNTRLKTHYLYSLAVVHFHYVEVKTVNPFAWRDEVTSLLVKILPDVDENLKWKAGETERRGKNGVSGTLVSLSGFAWKSPRWVVAAWNIYCRDVLTNNEQQASLRSAKLRLFPNNKSTNGNLHIFLSFYTVFQFSRRGGNLWGFSIYVPFCRVCWLNVYFNGPKKKKKILFTKIVKELFFFSSGLLFPTKLCV